MDLCHIYTCPSEVLSSIASWLRSNFDLVAFSLLTSRVLSLRLTGPRGVARLNVNGCDYRKWRELIRAFVHLRALDLNLGSMPADSFTYDTMLQFPCKNLTKLVIEMAGIQDAYLRPLAKHEWDNSKKGPTPTFAPINYASMFPQLTDLRLRDTFARSSNYLLPEWFATLPASLHTFCLGITTWNEDMFNALPRSLTQLGCYGRLDKLTFAPLENLPFLSHLIWLHSGVTNNSSAQEFPHLPSQITKLEIDQAEWVWNQLPPHLTSLRCFFTLPYGSANILSAADIASLPPSLTELNISSDQMSTVGDFSAHYSALPRNIRSLTWPLPPPENLNLSIYPNMHSLHLSSNDQCTLTSFSAFPQALHTFQLASSFPLNPNNMANFPNTITHLHISLKKFPSLYFGFGSILPQSLKILGLCDIQAKSNFKAESLSTLPQGLTHLTLMAEKEATEATKLSEVDLSLSDADLSRLPPNLTLFQSNFALELTGIGCESDCQKWDDELARKLCAQQLPQGAQKSFRLPNAVFVTLTQVPTALKSVSVIQGLVDIQALRRCIYLESLELGSRNPLLSPKDFQSLGYLREYTHHKEDNIDRLLKSLPYHIEKAVFPNSKAVLKRGMLPTSLTHLGVGRWYHESASTAHLKTLEILGESEYDRPPSFAALQTSNLESFIFERNGGWKAYSLKDYTSVDASVRQLPVNTIRHLVLPRSRRVSIELLCNLKNLKSLRVGLLVLTTPPVFTEGITTVAIPQSGIDILIAHTQVTTETVSCSQYLSSFKLNQLKLPSSVTSFTYRTESVDETVNAAFIANLPRGLLRLDLGSVRLDLRHCIASLPRNLHTCSLVIPMFPESAMEDLPPTITNLTLEQGIHSCSSLLPPQLTRLSLKPEHKQRQKIDDEFLKGLPRSITDLTLHGTTVTDSGIKHLPPSLTRLELHASALTMSGTLDLPMTIESLDFGFNYTLLALKHDILERLRLARLNGQESQIGH